MRRISSQMNNNDLQYHLRLKEYELNQAHNRMNTQNRVSELRDDPIAVAQGVRVNSIVRRANQYERNSESLQSEYRIAESFIAGTQDVMNRIRELAIQGANGIYDQDSLDAAGREINELLKQILTYTNGTGSRGQSVFSGDKVKGDAFRAVEGRVAGTGELMITNVEYVGSTFQSQVEIAEGEMIEGNFLGNEVFWAEEHSIYGAFDARNFRANADSQFYLDGQEINVETGDTVYSLMAKINDSKAAVKASLDPVTGALSLQTTESHQIWLDEPQGAGVLQDLGLTSDSAGAPPNNFHPDARVFGGSIFDVVIGMRDAFFAGDQESIGGRALVGIDASMDRLRQSRAELGAMDTRIEFNRNRLNYEIPELTARGAELTDLDTSEGIIELNMLDNAHKAILGTAGRVLKGSLLDYLR
jgi:flagellar hook-associated protein 3 FlgL